MIGLLKPYNEIFRRSGRPERAAHDWEQLNADLSLEEPRVAWLATLFGRSLFLSQRLIKNPELVNRLLRSEYLEQEKPAEQFLGELTQQLKPAQKDLVKIARVLRDYRYEETLRLAVRETAGLAPFETLGRERSNLAISCIENGYRILSGHEDDFCILGMGKLGGEDLNFSSDIDLIYFYSSDEKDDPHESSVRLGERLASLLSDKTEDGFVYRVDLGLRPEGNKGTLANSIDAMEDYYESFGDNWERMALIKAIPVAGNIALGNELCERVSPFVYPRHADLTTLAQLQDLKERMERSLSDKLVGEADPEKPGYNVKLGAGGIREIEFFVGSFQRLYGGKHKELRARQTLVALDRIAEQKLMSREDRNHLTEAYRFLRGVENRLQMVDERQTHTLPQTREDLEAFAIGLSRADETPLNAEQFQEQLRHHTGQVRRLWDQLLSRR